MTHRVMTVADLLDRAPELPSAWDGLDHRLIVEGECWFAAGYAALPRLADLAHSGDAATRDHAVRLAATVVRTLHRCVGFDHLVRAAAGHVAALHTAAVARLTAGPDFVTRLRDALRPARRGAVQHGRQPAVHGLDVSRTVGDLHCTFPLAFDDTTGQTPTETVAAVARRLGEVPSAGISFDALKFLNDDPAVRQRILAAPAPTLGFNFQGDAPARSAGGLFSLRDSPLGQLWDPDGGVRQPPLYLECSVAGGTTRLDWEYLPRYLGWSGGEIDRWTAAFRAELAGVRP